MKKFRAVFFVLLLLALVSPSYGAVGIKVDGTLSCTATDLGYTSAGQNLSCDGSTATFNLMLAGFGTSGSTSMSTSQEDVLPGYSFIRKHISADPAFNQGTLADGKNGQLLTIFISDVEGSGTFVLTPTTKTGFTSLSFDAAGDEVTLLFVDSVTGWIVVSYTSVTVTQP